MAEERALAGATNVPSAWAHVRSLLPEGLGLPRAAWDARHRFVLWAVAAHAVLLPAFGLYRGWGVGYSVGEGLVVAILGLVAGLSGLTRRARSTLASLALVLSSAILVQFSGGFIEAHFHYFIVIALIALYQDWVPFLMAILFVALEHGLVGSVAPTWVYQHAPGIERPWTWGLIHAVAVLGEAVALLAFWANAEQVRASNDLVLNSAGEGVLGLDPGGRITFANPAAGRVFGRAPDTLVGQDIRDLVPSVTLGTAALHAQAGSIQRVGGAVPVEWSLTPALRGGLVLGSVMVVRDVSARRELERQLALHQQDLQLLVELRTAELTRVNQDLESFSYTLSHDLRSPLRSIDGFSRILLRRHGDSLPEDSRQLLDMLSKSAARMGGLIETVLSLSRITRAEVAKRRLDLSAMAKGILDELAARDPARHVDTVVELGMEAEGDPALVRLALENLLGNAWKFTARSPSPRVCFHRHPSDPATFVVEDNGAGFDMANAKDLFQPFHRLHGPEEFEGTGIGLATVGRVIQRHGGRIRAEAAPGKGARFSFTLGPADPAPLAPLEPNEPDVPEHAVVEVPTVRTS